MVAKPQYSNTRNSPSAKINSIFLNPRVLCHSHSLFVSFVKKSTRIRFLSRSISVAEFNTPNIVVLSVTKFSAVRQISPLIGGGTDLVHRTTRSQPRRKRQLRATNRRQPTQNRAWKAAKSALRPRTPMTALERRVLLATAKGNSFVKYVTRHSGERPICGNI